MDHSATGDAYSAKGGVTLHGGGLTQPRRAATLHEDVFTQPRGVFTLRDGALTVPRKREINLNVVLTQHSGVITYDFVQENEELLYAHLTYRCD